MPTRPILCATASMLLFGFAFMASAQSGSPKGTPLVANAMDSMFMTHVAADDMAEIRMGQMALEKSSNAQVKQLAQRIVDDHTEANAKLRALAETKQVTLPNDPTSEAKQSADTMAKVDETRFDQAWTADMAKDHRKAVALFKAEIRRTHDPDVRAFAEKNLPTLETHLKLAQQLHGTLPPPKSGATKHGDAAATPATPRPTTDGSP